MNIFICCSKQFYHKIAPIKEELEKTGNIITLPNSYNHPMKEEEIKDRSSKEHIAWKSKMLRLQTEKVSKNDALLILNFEKDGVQNYIGGATFLEIFSAFQLNKKIFLYNPIPEGILKDELIGINPIILNGDISVIQ